MNTRRTAGIVLMGLAGPGWAAAQQPIAAPEPAEQAPVRVFVSAGLGPGLGPTVGFRDGPIAASGALTVNRGVHDYVLRAMAVGAVVEYGPTVLDVGLLYGRRLVPDRGRVRAAGGLAVTIYDDPEDLGPNQTLGLAGQVDFVFAPIELFGIGATLIANINIEQPVLGTLITLHLGDLR